MQRVGDRRAAELDRAARFIDALLQRADDFLTAIGERFRDLHHPRTERLVERVHASVERLAEPRDALIHDGRGLSGARADAAVEVVDVRAHRFGNFLGALA